MENIQKKVSIKPLIATRNFLAEIIQEAENDYEKAGAIQAFEVCYELARNTMRKILNLRDIRVDDTPRAIFRSAGVEGLISDVDAWIEFTRKRNKTSHAYDGEKANDILNSLPNFLRELNLLIENLEEMPECSN
jgi:nucleotidyltransferase substrate binding protein (TIGR01987 family)